MNTENKEISADILLVTFIMNAIQPAKEQVQKGETPSSSYTSPAEETPCIHLEKQIDFYRKLINRLETKEGIDKEVPDEKLDRLKKQLQQQCGKYTAAISLLNNTSEFVNARMDAIRALAENAKDESRPFVNDQMDKIIAICNSIEF